MWVADITYIPLRGGSFAYLALVLDLCSRRVVGWSLADHMTDTLVLDALQHAISAKQPPPKLIHHSDRGGQYAGHDFRAVLRRAAMRQSMSLAANCYDNAFMESCFGTIKTVHPFPLKIRSWTVHKKPSTSLRQHRERPHMAIYGKPAG